MAEEATYSKCRMMTNLLRKLAMGISDRYAGSSKRVQLILDGSLITYGLNSSDEPGRRAVNNRENSWQLQLMH